jgi:hypothetical protein
MKQKPENWKDLDIRRKMDFIMGRGTAVCNCTPVLGEHCKRCDAVPDIKHEDRNYHEEMLLLLRDMENNSRQPEVYSILRVLYELDDEEDFNRAVKEIIDNVEFLGGEEYRMENAFAAYHKTLRQYDHYNHLQITDTKKKDYVSSGCFQSILYDLIYISEVPYNMMKKLLSL